MKRDLYAKVTASIVAHLEAGTMPWVKNWSSAAGSDVPMNAVTERPYSGINVLLYWASIQSGWARPRFLTFRQAKAAGGFVRKGERGMPLYFFTQLDVVDQGTEQIRRIPMLREYTVFNIAQCDGLPERMAGAPAPTINHDARMSLADDFIHATGADVREGIGSPCYIPGRDLIALPSFAEFHNAPAFYASAFHELAHWTGHKARLDRDLKNRFGDNAYAMEELVAELTAAFLCAEFGMDNTQANHAAYLDNWLKVLKADSRAIFTVASKASAAAVYLRDAANAAAPYARAA